MYFDQRRSFLEPSLTFSADLDGARWSDLVAVFVPLPSDLLQRDLTHEDSVLVLWNVKVLQILQYLQLVFCEVGKTRTGCNASFLPRGRGVAWPNTEES